MAVQDELIEEFIGKKGFENLEKAEDLLASLNQRVADLNKQQINLELKLGGATSLKDFTKIADEMRSNDARMASSAKTYQDTWKQLLRERDEASKRSAQAASAMQKKQVQEERELNKLIAAERRVLDAQSREEKRKAVAERKQADRDYQNTWKQLLKERDALTSQQQARQKKAAADAAAAVAGDSLVGLRRTLSDATAGFDRLTRAERENADIGGVLRNRINELNKEIYASETATGRFQRNVGNYASAYNGLGLAIRNIASELPNAGISLRTFAQSISNNIQPLIEALKSVRQQNALLAAEGKPTVSVGKQLAASIFNWQTAILAAVAAITYLVTNMKTGSKASQDAEKANERYKRSLESIAESTRNVAQQDIARVQILTKLAADEKQAYDTRIRAVKELQETYPSTFGNLKQQAILEGELGDAVQRTTQQLLNRASAQAAEKRFAAAGEQVYDLELAIREQLKEVQKYENSLRKRPGVTLTGFASTEYQIKLDSARKKYREIREELEKARKEQAGFLNDALERSALAGDALLSGGPTKPTKEPRIKTPRDLTSETLKAEQDGTRELYAEFQKRAELEATVQQGIAEDETKSLQERLDAYDKYTQKRIEATGYRFTGEVEATQEALDKIAQIEAKTAYQPRSHRRTLSAAAQQSRCPLSGHTYSS